MNKKAFTAADPDRDDSLDRKEFAAAIVTRFKSVDPDNDGTIDLPEYWVALTVAAQKK